MATLSPRGGHGALAVGAGLERAVVQEAAARLYAPSPRKAVDVADLVAEHRDCPRCW
jgi:hypothetical protein